MVGAAYAAVPLYNGSVERPASAARLQVANRRPGMRSGTEGQGVRSMANVAGGRPWRSRPEQQTSVEVKSRRGGGVVDVSTIASSTNGARDGGG